MYTIQYSVSVKILRAVSNHVLLLESIILLYSVIDIYSRKITMEEEIGTSYKAKLDCFVNSLDIKERLGNVNNLD